MSHPLRLRPLLFAALLLPCAVGANASIAAAAGCPPDRYGLGYSGACCPVSDSTTAATLSVSFPGFAVASADHVQGTGGITAGGYGGCGEGGGPSGEGRLTYVEEYTLQGPAGAPVALTAVVHARIAMSPGYSCHTDQALGQRICSTAWGAAAGEVAAHAGAASDSVAWSLAMGGQPVVADLRVGLVASPGVPFQIQVTDHARSECSGSAAASHSIAFEDVPSGYSIVSCKASAAVPVRSLTWGRLKSVYR